MPTAATFLELRAVQRSQVMSRCAVALDTTKDGQGLVGVSGRRGGDPGQGKEGSPFESGAGDTRGLLPSPFT